MSPREQIHAVLARPWERPVRAAALRAVLALPAAVLVLLEQFVAGFFSAATPVSYLLAGAAVSFALWGADRLWTSTAAPLFARPYGPVAYATRAPFWYLAGGIALEAALLAIRAAGLGELYGVPARDLFDGGARVGLAGGALYHALTYPSVRRLLDRPPAAPPPERRIAS